MPLLIQVGQTGTLRFLPSQAGLDPALVQSTTWQMQGQPQACDFVPPDQVTGLAAGVQNFRGKITMATGGEALTYRFEVQCVPAGPPAPPKMVPVALDIALTPPTP